MTASTALPAGTSIITTRGFFSSFTKASASPAVCTGALAGAPSLASAATLSWSRS